MANRRYVHPGQSQVIGRDRRDYKAMNTATAGISVAGFDTAPRQHAADGSAKEAKKTFKDLRGTFTEEQMKIETSRCLGCGAAVVDESLCVGCGSFEKTILSGKDFLIREIHIPEDCKHLGSMFTMEPLSVQKVRDFFIRFKNATFFVKINFHKKSRCARQKS